MGEIPRIIPSMKRGQRGKKYFFSFHLTLATFSPQNFLFMYKPKCTINYLTYIEKCGDESLSRAFKLRKFINEFKAGHV